MDAFLGFLALFLFFGLYIWGWRRIARFFDERGIKFFLRHLMSSILAFFPAFFSLFPLILFTAKKPDIGGAIFTLVLFVVSVLVLFYATKIGAKVVEQIKPSEDLPSEEIPPVATTPDPTLAPDIAFIPDITPALDLEPAPTSAPIIIKSDPTLYKSTCVCRLCSRKVIHFTQVCPRCRAWLPAYKLKTLELAALGLVILARVMLAFAFDFSFFSWIDWIYFPAALIWFGATLSRLQSDDEAILERRRYDPNRVYPTAQEVAKAHRMQKAKSTPDVLRFVYEDADGRTSTRTVKNWEEDAVYIEGFCLDKLAVRTFRKDRVVTYLNDTDLLLSNPEPAFKELEATSEPIAVRQILFTGFSKLDRADLEQIARDNGFQVCQTVTVSLDYICVGRNAGPSKLAEARKRGAIELDEHQFRQLIETGEVPFAQA